MHFSHHLAEALVPEWRQHYINYEALKDKLKQARDASDEFLEAAQPLATSLSIPRSVSQQSETVLHHLQHSQRQHHELEQEQQQDRGSLEPLSSLQQQHLQQRSSSGGGKTPSPAFLRVPAALQLDGGPAEQFLQLLQQELNKVRDFISAQGSSLQAELQALAAAAPQLSLQDCRQLEQQAHELGRQLLALEAYMQLNQTGFVKICKKHDKLLPEAPIWHLYLHHLQRSPWLDDSMRQYMWAALSSCYYHLHAASIYSSRERQEQQQQQARQQQAGVPPLPPQQQASALPLAQQQQRQQAYASNMQPQVSASSRKVAGGLTAALGSAMAGAASAVATAAGASAAALAAAAATAAGSGPPAAQPGPSSSAAVVSRAQDDAQDGETVRFTRKFWVQEADVSAVMYFILQHLPLLPSTSHTAAAARGAEGSGDGVTTSLGGGQRRHQQPQSEQPPQQQVRGGSSSTSLPPQQQPHQAGSSSKQRQQQPLLQPALDGFTTTLHTVYFDNSALQLYHGRLYLRPRTQTLKARWIGQGASAHSNSSTHSASSIQQGCGETVRPDKVVLERKIYREGWRGEANTKDSLLIAGDKLPQYLAGAYTLGDALADLCEVPACKAQLRHASSTVQRQQKQQRQSLQPHTTSPFVQTTAAAAAAHADSGDAADEQAAAALAASVRLPSGFAIGSFSSRSFDQLGSSGSHPSLLQLLEREQQQRESPQADGAAAAQPATAAPAAEDDELQAGFADAYLDPPVPTADQLSLFTEVQRFVGRMRLRPVLHSVLRRMVFAMPFDDRIRITIDTDVTTRALDAPPADWPQIAPGSSSMLDTVPPGLHASDAAWNAVFSTQSAAQEDSPRHYQHSREPGSPLHPAGSSGGGAGPVWHPMPYALMKVSCRLQANQSAPDWLQQVMGSEAVIPVEDWSKFIHGCAVLLPDIIRAVPYWIDDELVELSVSTLQAKLEAEEARRSALQQQHMQAHHQRNSSTGSLAGSICGRTSSGGLVEGAAVQEQQQQPMLQRLSGSFRAALTRASSSGGGSGSRVSHTGSSADGSSGSNVVSLPQQPHEQQNFLQSGGQGSHVGEPASQASYVNPTSSSHKPSRLRVKSQDGAAVHRVSWADGGPRSSSLGGGGSTGGAETASAVAASAGGWGLGVLGALWQLVHKKKKPPPLFRPEGSRTHRRPRRYNPVHLIDSREYLYSEAVFLNWLNLAITLASVAILLMGYSSMAYVNPLKRPTLHVAEIICLLMLPASCIIVVYAIQSYVWRGKRLHSMRYSRVDDPIGPLAMALVFVACMTAVMMVNIADIVLLLQAKDEPGGGDEGGEVTVM